jgi:ADP-ribose pyrophosphatase
MSLAALDRDTPTAIEIAALRTAYRGYFRVDEYRLRHGRFGGGLTGTITREVFERGHAAALLPYDPERDVFVLCQQFRIGAHAAGMDPWQIECVAGIIEHGETAEDVARREALEEAGLAVREIIPMQRCLVSPGGSSETVSLYLGRVSAAGAGGLFGLAEEDEDIRVFTLTSSELRALLDGGKVTNASTVIALQWYFLNRERVAAAWRS